jgi:hypothetical protein
MIKVIKRKSDKLDFGKHNGQTIRWIIEFDPSYILWMHENNVIEIPQKFVDEAIDSDIENTFNESIHDFFRGHNDIREYGDLD